MMRKQHIVVLLLFAGFVATRIFTFFPDRSFDPFPLYDILDDRGENVGINIQTYVYFIGQYALFIAIFWLIWSTDEFKYEGMWLFWLWVADLMDFLIRYNESFVTVLNFDLEYTDIQLCLIALLVLRRLWKTR